MPYIPVIAIGGGPCGGKSTFLVRAREWLEKFGLHPLIISETATELITAGASPAVVGLEPFQEHLFLYSLDREQHYLKIANGIKRNVVILCDRGVLDCAAYMGAESYQRMIKRLGYTQDELRKRYHLVIHLVTAADGAEGFYTLANNAARSETAEEARALDAKTQSAWLGHPHHILIDNSTDFAAKMQRALCSLSRRLDMPEPTEIERKFRILNFAPQFIPEGAVAVEITQDYLLHDGPGERRVRQRVCNGEASFFYTEKLPRSESGTRVEQERQINETEYQAFLKGRDMRLSTIKKTRHHFPFGGKLFELDIFGGNNDGLVMLEVELQRRDEAVSLPPHWEIIEVTDDPSYKNRSLATS